MRDQPPKDVYFVFDNTSSRLYMSRGNVTQRFKHRGTRSARVFRLDLAGGQWIDVTESFHKDVK